MTAARAIGNVALAIGTAASGIPSAWASDVDSDRRSVRRGALDAARIAVMRGRV